jgi:hypothetical protein
MIDPALLAEIRRALNALRLPEYMRDLVRAVPDSAVRELVNDFRSYNVHPAQDPAAKANPIDAAPAKTGSDVVAGNGTGWVDSPEIKNYRAPGIDIIDRLVDQQDALDRAARVRELVEAAGAMAALKEPEQKERKERKDKEGK